MQNFSCNRFQLYKQFLLAAIWSICGLASVSGTLLHAQIEIPNRKYLFEEDNKLLRDLEAKKLRKQNEEIPGVDGELSVNAPNLSYLKSPDRIRGEGGAMISGQGVRVQADSLEMNTESKDAELDGSVLFATKDIEIKASKAKLNLDAETGDFSESELTLEREGYAAKSKTMQKVSEFVFNLEDAIFSACRCSDGEAALTIECSEAKARQEGYAQLYDTSFWFYGVPFFYSPYFLFPVKTERATGMLMPSMGYSRRDGYLVQAPLFGVLDESSDVLLTPFLETRTRVGASAEYRQAFSQRNALRGGLIYSDESARGDSLRGTLYRDPSNPSVAVTSLNDLTSPSFKTDRIGAFFSEIWSTDRDADLPASFIADGRYVSDDLFVREMNDQRIGDQESQYLSSVGVFRISPFDSLTADISSEYNQYLDTTNDDYAFHRFPEANVNFLKSFRPFGPSPYGLKITAAMDASATKFQRNLGYEGDRYRMVPRLSMPVYFGNYLENSLAVGMYQTNYSSLTNNFDPLGRTVKEDAQQSSIGTFTYSARTGLERVYDVDKDGLFSRFLSLGIANQKENLLRVKHVITPMVTYQLTGDTSQGTFPQYDPNDSIPQKRLLTFALDNSLLGRFSGREEVTEPIPEFTPRIDQLPIFGSPLPQLFGTDAIGAPAAAAGSSPVRGGTVRDLLHFGVIRGYDYVEKDKNLDPNRGAWTDLTSYVSMAPSSYFSVAVTNDYNFDRSGTDGWDLRTQFRDDRGDLLHAWFTYTDNAISQIHGSTEIAITNRVRVGYYGRYDQLTDKFDESKGILRIYGGCNCWHLDLGIWNRINPDKELFTVNFTFAGLGGITQDMLYKQDNQQK